MWEVEMKFDGSDDMWDRGQLEQLSRWWWNDTFCGTPNISGTITGLFIYVNLFKYHKNNVIETLHSSTALFCEAQES